MNPLDFYFDFSSPYGYIGAHKIDALAQRYNREVAWHPILLGVLFRKTGAAPLSTIPVKGDYSIHDFSRSAKFHGLDFKYPSPFPISTHLPARAFYWIHERAPMLAKTFALELYRAYFVLGIDISLLHSTLTVASTLGIDSPALGLALAEETVKNKLRTEVDIAMRRGVFGSPFVFVDGEPFWGVDRFDQIERWLATGGW